MYGNKIGWWRSPGDRDFYYFFKDSYIAAPKIQGRAAWTSHYRPAHRDRFK
jgi:hypothetical protein